MKKKVYIRKLRDGVKTPTKAYSHDAGFDLYTPDSFILPPGGRWTVNLGFALELPEGTVALVQGKSGMAHTEGLTTIGNVIDAGYRGECHVILLNTGSESIHFIELQKVAQLVIIQLANIENKLEEREMLSESERDSGGLGSTGKGV